ncbi:Cysteine--tRNA ligase [Frankliniella fusca]|uniref:Cysteine--tRNA ligase n=1 Tax=Frankliniella fusca TaxID=407009 RepID=A0AAE1HWS5_9NEOP|nr:Cysteine--tRNA ligase [Frankliniella fusca]
MPTTCCDQEKIIFKLQLSLYINYGRILMINQQDISGTIGFFFTRNIIPHLLV